jgi:hypothetical protein
MCGSANVKPIRVALVLAALALVPSRGFGWGRDGHQVIANLAQSRPPDLHGRRCGSPCLLPISVTQQVEIPLSPTDPTLSGCQWKAQPEELASGPPTAQQLADLMAVAKAVGEVPAWENAYVRVHYAVLEYPAVERRVAESRPVVLYVRVAPEPQVVNTRLLDAPQGARPSWRPGVVPRGVRIEVLTLPPAPSALGEPGTDPPQGATTDEHGRYRLVLATFRPLDYGVGTGRLPSVTIFLSDGVVEVWSRGVRRRMGVQAGDAFWFEAATRLTVVDDYPVGAAIVQLCPR